MPPPTGLISSTPLCCGLEGMIFIYVCYYHYHYYFYFYYITIIITNILLVSTYFIVIFNLFYFIFFFLLGLYSSSPFFWLLFIHSIFAFVDLMIIIIIMVLFLYTFLFLLRVCSDWTSCCTCLCRRQPSACRFSKHKWLPSRRRLAPTCISTRLAPTRACRASGMYVCD